MRRRRRSVLDGNATTLAIEDDTLEEDALKEDALKEDTLKEDALKKDEPVEKFSESLSLFQSLQVNRGWGFRDLL